MVPQATLKPTSMWRRAATVAVASAFALASCFPLPEASSAPPSRSATSAVRAVQVSDIRDAAFFVSWVSDQPEVGAVRWGAAGSSPGTRVADIRGDVASTVHLVKVTGLNASTAYVFDVLSGSTVDDQGGQHYRATTGPTLPISQSDSIYGRVLDGGNGPARNVLVTITVRGSDGTAAAPMVSLIGPNDDGYWTSNLGNARAANGLTWFSGLTNARVELSADGGELGKASTTLELAPARAGTSVVKLDGKAPALGAGVPSTTLPVSLTPPPGAGCTSPSAGGAPVPGGASGPSGGAGPASSGAPPASGGATGRPIVVAPGTIALPALPDGSILAPSATLDAASPRPGFPATPNSPSFQAPPLQAPVGAVRPVTPTVPSSGLSPLNASGTTIVTVDGVGDVTMAIAQDTRSRLERTGIASIAVAFDAAPPLENEVQAGSLGGGVVVPVARPIELRLDLRDSTGNPVRPDPDGTTVDITLPVLPSPPDEAGTFAWLVATYDADGFAGYERPPAAFDPSTNQTTVSVSPAGLQGTLFLPTLIVPATVATLDADVRMWSTPWSDAVDFGPVGPALTDLVVVAPQVRGRIYVYNPVTANYGWVSATQVGPA
jgi:hypothetical protein